MSVFHLFYFAFDVLLFVRYCRDKQKPYDDISGTPYYLAPEIIEYVLSSKHERGELLPSPSFDVWAFGVLFCYCLQGYQPFLPFGNDRMELFKNITNRVYDFNKRSVSIYSAALACAIFERSPRITFEQMNYFEQ